MDDPVVAVERIDRDIPCRGWEIVLKITKGDDVGYYTFFLGSLAWRKARDGPEAMKDGEHGPFLAVEPAIGKELCSG